MPRISLCMIARDEEEFLPGLLDSVRGAVDEIVLVDTGSVDRTRELAKAAGAIVLEQPWKDDFAAPRNLGLARAKGDFVLVLDADERLAPGAGGALRRAVRNASFDIGFLRLHNAARLDALPEDVLSGAARIGERTWLPRVLRRAGGLQFEGVVHENVSEWFLRRGGRSEAVDADLIHLGAIPALRERRSKRTRNVTLLRVAAAAAPDDATPLGYLAMELYDSGEVEAAAEVAERAWALLDTQPAHRWMARVGVARALVSLSRGDPERALESAQRLEAREGPNPDLRFLAGSAAELLALRLSPGSAERAALLEQAAAAHLAALELVRRGGTAVILLATPALVLTRLGIALLLLGRAGEARSAFGSARELGAGDPARWGEAEALAATGDGARALALLEPALDRRPDGWVVAAAAALSLDARADARLFLEKALQPDRPAFVLPHLAARARDLSAGLLGAGR